MESKYYINVAKKKNPEDEYGVHFLRIELPEHFEEDAVKKLKFLKELFGDEFNVDMSYMNVVYKRKREWE